MQENEDNRQQEKHPMEMTSDELLDFVVAPQVAKKLKERVRDDPPDDCDDSQE
jgi:hypothetical protein